MDPRPPSIFSMPNYGYIVMVFGVPTIKSISVRLRYLQNQPSNFGPVSKYIPGIYLNNCNVFDVGFIENKIYRYPQFIW